MPSMLAWTPFIQPAPGVPSYWWALVLPLSFLISMAWKAVRQTDLAGYWSAVLRMSAQIVLGMVALSVLLALVVRVLVPIIPAN